MKTITNYLLLLILLSSSAFAATSWTKTYSQKCEKVNELNMLLKDYLPTDRFDELNCVETFKGFAEYIEFNYQAHVTMQSYLIDCDPADYKKIEFSEPFPIGHLEQANTLLEIFNVLKIKVKPVRSLDRGSNWIYKIDFLRVPNCI